MSFLLKLVLGGIIILATNLSHATEPLLLIPGMVFHPGKPDPTWGHRSMVNGSFQWTGTIGFLQRNGYRFGGYLQVEGAGQHSRISLNAVGADAPARNANFFVLRFSPNAAIEGLTVKGQEIAQAIAELKRQVMF